MSMSGYSIASSGKVVVGLVVGMALVVVVGAGSGSASVRTLSAWARFFITL
jgi:hypothetical protein